jgi:site-specific recombinase XerD
MAIAEAGAGFDRASRAANTLRGYGSDLRQFEGWCAQHGRESRPASAETVREYIAALAVSGRKASTITRHLSAIAAGHKLAGLPSPTSDETVKLRMIGVRNTLGTAPRQARALSVADLKAMLAACPADIHGLRDRAVLLVGFLGALRRSELVSLDCSNVTVESDGLRIVIVKSKTDQEGRGRLVGLRRGRPGTDVVTAVAEWREAAGIEEGPLFRGIDRAGRIGERLSDRGVARIVQVAAKRAGIDPERLSGHSLRAGLATSAARAGASERAIMNQTGHSNLGMVRRYIRAGELLGPENVTNVLDL